jgi:hypothetical protein
VYQELKSIEEFQHNMGALLNHGEVYTKVSRNCNTVGQVRRTRKEQDAHPHPLLTATLRAPVSWSTKPDEWLLMKGPSFHLRRKVKEAVHERLASQRHFFFCGNPAACETLKQVYWKARGLCWKMI